MFKKITPLNSERHGALKLKQDNTFHFAGGTHVASIMTSEFYRAATTYPIVFVEEPKNDEFRPVVLLGLQPKKNLFVNAEGKWEAIYIPAILRRYPFVLARTEEDGRFAVCVDEDSGFFSETEGQPLFDGEGQPGQLLENVKKYLAQLQQMDQVTQQFCQTLKEHNLFAPLNMRVRKAESVQNITGAYAINDKRMDALSDETFLEWRKQKILPLIYNHLFSLSNIERLVQLRTQTIAHEKSLLDDLDSDSPLQ